MNHKFLSQILQLWGHINGKRKKQVALLLLLMVAASFAELISIGLIFPFLAVLTAPKNSLTNFEFSGLTLPIPSTSILTIFFCFAFLFSSAVRLLLLWSSTKIAYGIGSDLSGEIYKRTLYQPYYIHVQRNSSEIISGISNKTASVTYVINAALTFLSSLVMLLIIAGALVLSNPFLVLTVTAGFGLIYSIVVYCVSSRLLVNSANIARETNNVLKSLQEGLGGIRDILLDETQEVFFKIFKKAEINLRQALAENLFISTSPRFVMEALGMVLIAIISYFIVNQNNSRDVIPLLGMLALAAQRLLPILQQMYAAWSGIKGNYDSISDAIILLEQPMPNYLMLGGGADKLHFSKCIELSNLGFRYSPKSRWVFRGINSKIQKGRRIGFVGETGVGKSTLLDILMGLLTPSEGELTVDGVAVNDSNCHLWRKQIAHVPQAIFLSDASILENIAFGVPMSSIDFERVKNAAKLAKLSETIESWPLRYETRVGERGVKLSGGQRQRIAIARALYKNASIIIFDEATSALDSKTEQDVMEAIYGLGDDVTLLIIAHRHSTLKRCDQIYHLSASGLHLSELQIS